MKKQLALVFLFFLRTLAKIQLAKVKFLLKLQGKKLHIVGITGSAGKTSTLLATEAILKSHFRVKTNSGANSESGIPLNILGLKATNFSPLAWFKLLILAKIKLLTNWQTYDIYLVEMGIDEPNEPKNMSYLLKIVKPDIGIFLNVNPVHVQNFKSIDQIGQEKSKLINSLSHSATAIINTDDPIVTKTTLFCQAKKLTLGTSSNPTLKIIKTQIGPNGFTATYSFQNQHFSINLKKHILPEIYNVSFAAALLTASALNLNISDTIKNLENNLEIPPSRSNLLQGINNTQIIDSSYNSSPLACQEMLKLLSRFPGKRIAVLGDMRELGNQSEISHQEIYKTAIKSADLIIGVGPETQKYFCTNAAQRVPTHTFQFWWQALNFLKKEIHSNDTILVKGSQNTIYLEELVKSLLKNPEDQKLLCRQSPYWLKTKEKFKKTNS